MNAMQAGVVAERAIGLKPVPPHVPFSADSDMTAVRKHCIDAFSLTAEFGNDAHRVAAVQALGQIADITASGTLLHALGDPDQDVREAAVWSLGKVTAESAVPQLIDSLRNDPVGDVKVAVIETLEKLDSSSGNGLLLELAQQRGTEVQWDDISFTGWDEWLDVQLLTIGALGRMAVDGAAEAIVAALEDPEAQNLSVVATYALSSLGTQGRAALLHCLKTGDARLRRHAASRLTASMAVESELPVFRSLIRDSDPQVRCSAVKVLAAHASNTNWLITACTDPDASVRAEIARACGLRLDRRVFKFLDDPSDEVKLATLGMIERESPQLVEKGRDELVAHLIDNHDSAADAVVSARICALATLGGRRVKEHLASLLDNPDAPEAARSQAVRAIAREPDMKVTQQLIEHIKDGARQVRLDVLTALAVIANSEGDSANAAQDALMEILRCEPAVVVTLNPPAAASVQELTEPGSEEGLTSAVIDTSTFPVSTLAAILDESTLIELDHNQQETDPQLTAGDLQRLEMAARRRKRKHVSLEPDIPLELDVRYFTTRVAGDIPLPAVTQRLVELLLDERDQEWRKIAAESLLRCLQAGADCPSLGEEALSSAWQTAGLGLRISLLRLMHYCQVGAASGFVLEALQDTNPSIRLEALKLVPLASEVRSFAYESLLEDDASEVRVEALRQWLENNPAKASTHALSMLFDNGGFDRKAVVQALKTLTGTDAQLQLANGLLTVIGEPARQRDWCFAIEALAEIVRH